MEKRPIIRSSMLPVEASAPCRIDLGGTLDISTFYYSLMGFAPCTFNIALDMRTRVILNPYKKGWVKISSAGFQSAEYPSGKAPFDHPLGLMFAIAHYFDADGVHIEIASASPIKSALGGSSSAAVALTGAFSKLAGQGKTGRWSRKHIAMLAHDIETITAQAPCGIQDQLAAAYGGVHAWYWRPGINGSVFTMKTVVGKKDFHRLEDCILLAYCGEPHESLNVNGKWAKQFISGEHRDFWKEIIQCTHGFIDAVFKKDVKKACAWMNRETHIRRIMTPDVLNDIGEKLVEAAKTNRCGARFTGAGAGGCLWAYGKKEDIDMLRGPWEKVLSEQGGACLLEVRIDSKGLVCH